MIPISLTKFFVNNIDWKQKNINLGQVLLDSFLGKLKNVNYEAKNISIYKNDTTNELFGALGFLTKIDFFKQSKNETKHFLSPKVLIKIFTKSYA